MSTLNHDTELEEILDKLGEDFIEFSIADVRETWTEDKQAAIKALHTYLYKQTLELIGPDLVNINGAPSKTYMNRYKDQLRKAAAERWGQE